MTRCIRSGVTHLFSFFSFNSFLVTVPYKFFWPHGGRVIVRRPESPRWSLWCWLGRCRHGCRWVYHVHGCRSLWYYVSQRWRRCGGTHERHSDSVLEKQTLCFSGNWNACLKRKEKSKWRIWFSIKSDCNHSKNSEIYWTLFLSVRKWIRALFLSTPPGNTQKCGLQVSLSHTKIVPPLPHPCTRTSIFLYSCHIPLVFFYLFILNKKIYLLKKTFEFNQFFKTNSMQ